MIDFFFYFKGKIAHFLGFRDKGWGAERQFCSCLEKTEYERFFFATIPELINMKNLLTQKTEI